MEPMLNELRDMVERAVLAVESDVRVVESGEDAVEAHRGLSMVDAALAAGIALATALIDQALDALADEQMAAAMAAEDHGDFDLDEACPGCGHQPGDGLNSGCHHPDGCGYWRELEREATSVAADLAFDAARERDRR